MSASRRLSECLIAPLLVLCAACASNGQAAATNATGGLASSPVNLDSLIRAAVGQGQTPGISAIVMSGDAIVGSGVSGVRTFGRADPIRAGDMFHIGSVLKPMTMTMLATLVDQGTLSWDRTIAAVFPELAAQMRPEYRDITLQELIAHRSGLPAMTSGPEAAKMLDVAGPERDNRLAAVRGVLAMSPAGKRGEYLYSNAGIMIAAAMAERVTGKAYSALMAERIFAPLRMTTAGIGWPVVRDSAQPWGHRRRDDQFVPTGPGDPYRLSAPILPAGNMSMSVEDLARFGAAQLHLFRGEPSLTRPATLRWRFFPTGGNPAPETSVEILRADGMPAPFGERGADTVWTDDGSAGTFFARLLVDPKANLVIAIGANAMAEDAVNALQQRLYAWARQRNGPTAPTAIAPPRPEANAATSPRDRLNDLLDVIRSQSGARARAFVDSMAPSARAGSGEKDVMTLLERLTDTHGALDLVRIESSSNTSIVAVTRGARGGGERVAIQTEGAPPFRILGLTATPIAP